MTITKWKPFEGLFSMQDRINRLFDDELRGAAQGTDALNNWYPAADIYETKDDFVFKLEVPGLAKDDINVELINHVLTIKGEKKEQKEIKKEDYHRFESYSGTFSRSFTLPKNVDSQKIDAALKDGILELRVAKAEEAKPQSIAIAVK